ncbi:hypothetical protein AURDEDRAFT_159822 [Auricularia subglabra TFB-10046 SS5]|nr:hypothetical protein AURDEDRAFT_159822 [Auricularia subglabra TFB-10046 SS5]
MPNSLEYQDESGHWVAYCGGNVFVQRTYVEPQGEVYLRARTAVNLSGFPLSYFSDMEQRLGLFNELTSDVDHPMSEFDAYSALFETAPTSTDLDSLRACLGVLQASPRRLRELSRRPTRLGKQTWIDFVTACEDHESMPQSLHESPLLRRQRRGPVGVATESPEAVQRWRVPSTPRRHAWQGPPPSHASSSSTRDLHGRKRARAGYHSDSDSD